MAHPNRPLFPQTQRRAEDLGERLRLARLRRRMSLRELSARTQASRITLSRLEQGQLTTNLGVLLRVLGVLGLDADLEHVARDDELGRWLQDVGLTRPRRLTTRSDD